VSLSEFGLFISCLEFLSSDAPLGLVQEVGLRECELVNIDFNWSRAHSEDLDRKETEGMKV
jgi:hypothetical protein